MVTADVRRSRLAVCDTCKNKTPYPNGDKCKLCGCDLEKISKITKSYCKANKWNLLNHPTKS